MRLWIKLVFDAPVRVHRFRLDPKKQELFNNGDFARTDYKYLYEMEIDKGEGKTYIHLATPDFGQVLYSIKNLWNAYEGKPYDRHNHPVVMQAFDIAKFGMESKGKETDKEFQKTYKKNRELEQNG